jgi:hypothetical protein
MMKKLLMTLAFLSATLLIANDGRGGQRGGMDRQPPQEAISVCEGQSEGATCEMTTPRGESVSGTCTNTPDGKYFACKPENMKRD